MTPRRSLLVAFGAAIALAGSFGCAPEASGVLPAWGFAIDREAAPAVPVPVDVAGRPVPLPESPDVPDAPPTAAPMPAGAGGGGAAWVDPPSKLFTPPPDALATGLALGGPTTGTLTLMAPDYVASTVVIAGAPGVPALHPRPVVGPVAPTGVAEVAGSLGPSGAGYLVSYRSAGHTSFTGASADATGAYRFRVPVDGAESGYVIAAERAESPAIALARVTVTAGETLLAPALVPAPPVAAAGDPPALPAGMRLAPARLVVLEPTGRVELLAFTSGRVPRYAAAGLPLAGVYEAEAPDGSAGAEVVTDGRPGEELVAPGVASLPAAWVPGAAISWGAVPGATLYTVELRRLGAPAPLWEGASPVARIVLPEALPRGLDALEATVTAWNAPGVTPYSVASARQLRVPAAPATAGARRSWARRRGLST